jgi:hypothetical protein
MRKIVITCCGIFTLVFPTASFALCPVTDDVQAFLDADPVSTHYIGAVVERIEDGLANIENNSSSTGNSFTDAIAQVFWSGFAQNSVNMTLDIGQDQAAANRNLYEHTACLRADTRIIEAQLENIRCKLQEAYSQKNGKKMYELRRLLLFTQEVLVELSRGALDPFYMSTTWGTVRIFDDTSSVVCMEVSNPSCLNCCKEGRTLEQCASVNGQIFYREYGMQTCLAAGGTLPPNTPDPGTGMCPFHSNYLPPTTLGYGCDIEAMEPITTSLSDLEPFRSEYSALQELIDKRNEFIEESESLGDLRRRIDAFMGKTTPNIENFGMSLEREHKEVFGCIPPVFFDEATNEKMIDFNPLYSSGATFTEMRGPFSFGLYETKLSRLLLEKALNREDARLPPAYLETFYTTSNQDEFRATITAATNVIARGVVELLRPVIRSESDTLAINKAEVLGFSQDMLMQITESYKPLRESIGGLSRSAGTKSEGIRHFGINFAWYLRRSCLERPCTKTLDRVLKILLADECFPYTSGQYKGQDAFEACKNAADL